VAPAKSLGPIIIVLNAIGAVWALIVGISMLKDLSDPGETSKLKTFDIVYAILCFVACATESLGFTAAVTHRLNLARIYAKVALFNVLLLLGIG
jgi:hypothetical protein